MGGEHLMSDMVVFRTNFDFFSHLRAGSCGRGKIYCSRTKTEKTEDAESISDIRTHGGQAARSHCRRDSQGVDFFAFFSGGMTSTGNKVLSVRS